MVARPRACGVQSAGDGFLAGSGGRVPELAPQSGRCGRSFCALLYRGARTEHVVRHPLSPQLRGFSLAALFACARSTAKRTAPARSAWPEIPRARRDDRHRVVLVRMGGQLDDQNGTEFGNEREARFRHTLGRHDEVEHDEVGDDPLRMQGPPQLHWRRGPRLSLRRLARRPRGAGRRARHRAAAPRRGSWREAQRETGGPAGRRVSTIAPPSATTILATVTRPRLIPACPRVVEGRNSAASFSDGAPGPSSQAWIRAAALALGGENDAGRKRGVVEEIGERLGEAGRVDVERQARAKIGFCAQAGEQRCEVQAPVLHTRELGAVEQVVDERVYLRDLHPNFGAHVRLRLCGDDGEHVEGSRRSCATVAANTPIPASGLRSAAAGERPQCFPLVAGLRPAYMARPRRREFAVAKAHDRARTWR